MPHSEKKQKETPGGKSFRTNLNKTGKIKKKSIELKKKNKKKEKNFETEQYELTVCQWCLEAKRSR